VSEIFTVVPDESPHEHMSALMSAIAMTSARFGNVRKRQSAIQQESLHPNYLVFVGTSRVNADYMPGARAFYISAEIGPDASKADSERLFRFDLSCLTRTSPCSRQDLMPAACGQYEIDLQHLIPPQQSPCHLRSHRMSRNNAHRHIDTKIEYLPHAIVR
jgi:hypothetical protein